MTRPLAHRKLSISQHPKADHRVQRALLLKDSPVLDDPTNQSPGAYRMKWRVSRDAQRGRGQGHQAGQGRAAPWVPAPGHPVGIGPRHLEAPGVQPSWGRAPGTSAVRSVELLQEETRQKLNVSTKAAPAGRREEQPAGTADEEIEAKQNLSATSRP